MRRIAPSVLVLCALVAAIVPAAAQASRSQSMTFEAPVDLANPATRTQAFDEISSFGVKSTRIVLLWQNVAPAAASRVKPDFDATDPTKYDWSAYDPQVDGAVARGWSVLLQGRTEAVVLTFDLATLWADPGLVPWAPGTRNLFIAVTPHTISGRSVQAPFAD